MQLLGHQRKGCMIVSHLMVAAVYSQDIGPHPPCAEIGALSKVSETNCAVNDIRCICEDSAWIANLTNVFCEACPPADVGPAKVFASSLCLFAASKTIYLPPASTAPVTITVSSAFAAESGTSSQQYQATDLVTTISILTTSTSNHGVPASATSLSASPSNNASFSGSMMPTTTSTTYKTPLPATFTGAASHAYTTLTGGHAMSLSAVKIGFAILGFAGAFLPPYF